VSIATLRRIAELVAAGEPVPAVEAEWLATVVRTYEERAPEGETLDRVAGLLPEPGGESWWRAERRRARDDALCALAATFHADLPAPRAAAVIATQLRCYEGRGWLLDRRHDAMPTQYAGTSRALMFTAFKFGPVPTGVRQITMILQRNFGSELDLLTADASAHDDSNDARER
jgi:hypothetical protein